MEGKTEFQKIVEEQQDLSPLEKELFKLNPYNDQGLEMISKGKYFLVEYTYLTSPEVGESYDFRTIKVYAKNEKIALWKAKTLAHTRGAKDFTIV